jgi:hypothetical protein
VPINYVGHAEQWDEIVIDGDITAKDCLLKYKHKGRLLAVASIFRDLASLQAEVEMEREVILSGVTRAHRWLMPHRQFGRRTAWSLA